MTIEVLDRPGCCVLVLEGALTYPDAVRELRRVWKETQQKGHNHFVIDLLQVPWLDSSGIGEVVACYKRAREAGGLVKLVLRARPYNSFTYCHLNKMFEMFGALREALASFGPRSETSAAHPTAAVRKPESSH